MNPLKRAHLCVLAMFVLVTLVVTWPLVLNFNHGVPFGGDAFQFIWNGWWFTKAFHNPELNLWWTPYQYAQVGASLSLHDLSPFNAFLQMLLSPVLGEFGSFNLLIILHYILGAWGAYILTWYLTGNRSASVIAGIIYGFSVHHAMHLSQLSTASSGFLPLAVYYLLKYTRDGGWRDGIFSVLMIVAGTLSSWYYLIFTGLLYFLFMIFGQFGLREHLSGIKRWQRAILPFLASVLILSPLLINAWMDVEVMEIPERIELGKLFYFDPAWGILPPPDNPVLGWLTRPLEGTIPGNPTEGTASFGIIAIIFGILAWTRRDPATRAWCWVGLILFALALGTKVTIMGHATPVTGPFAVWSEIPGLNLIRVPARFIGPYTLALAIKSAGWVAGLPDSWRHGFKRTLLLWIIPALMIIETLVIPIPFVGREYDHPALHRLSDIYMEHTGSPTPPDLVVNFPLIPQRAQFLYQQTLHGIPTLDGALSNPPPSAWEYLAQFNWNPEYLERHGVDLVIYQSWAAQSRAGERFHIPPDAQGHMAQWADQYVEPVVFFRDVMQYDIAFEDDRLILFIP